MFVQSQGDFLYPCLGPLLRRNGRGHAKKWGRNKKMSRGVNTETGVWQGTMIGFINRPMLFSLLGDYCKTLSANWSSQGPTPQTLSLHSPTSRSPSSSPVFTHIASRISFLTFFSRVPLDFLLLCLPKIDWPRKHPFCFHHHPCIFFSSGRGVSSILLSPQTSGWCTTSNIFSSWSGTEHIRDGSVKVIRLAPAIPGNHFSSFESVCLPANTIDFLSAP